MGTGRRDAQMRRVVRAHSQVVLLAWETGLTDFYTSSSKRPLAAPTVRSLYLDDDEPQPFSSFWLEHVRMDNTEQTGGQGKGRESAMAVYTIATILNASFLFNQPSCVT